MFKKALLTLMTASTLVFAASTAQAESGIVVMNYQSVLFNSAAAVDAQTELNEVLSPGQKQLNDIAKQIQVRQSRLETDQDILTEEEIQTYQQELQMLSANQAQLTNRIQQIQQQMQQEFIEEFRPTIREIVADYVSGNDVSLVLDAQSVLWNESAPDITDIVMAEFDTWYEEQKPAEDSAAE